MKVLKFGGTSVGNAGKIQDLIKILNTNEKQIVVLSAVAGTTNSLVEIAQFFLENKIEAALKKTKELKEQYISLIQKLFSTDEGLSNGSQLVNHHFTIIENLALYPFRDIEEKIVLAQGELLSTALFHYYLQEIGQDSVLLPALDFMKIDEDNEPIVSYIEQKLGELLSQNSENKIFITQGFICRNNDGEIDNLRRGGSDYTASLIGAAIQAEEVQIWTDIDGMHNNDPRIVSNTKPIAHLSFNEAAELAYFGAKILHPQCVFPAQKYNIPVRLLNTENPSGKGTLISQDGGEKGVIRAIAAKDDITAIHIHSTRMLMAYGFLRRVFEVFENYKTPIDMITTSEVAVSLSIDQISHLDKIVKELESFGSVSVDRNQTIVCVVGDFAANTHGYAARVLDAVKHLPIRMISYGGSDYNVSILLDSVHKVEALRSLHNRLF